MKSTRRHRIAVIVAAIACALAIIVVRLLVDARAACRDAEAAEQHGDTATAIRRYLDAGRLYVPGSPYMRKALDRLDAIAVAHVTSGDYATARAAFEAERAAMLGTRSFYTPYAARLPELERRLARLMAATKRKSEPRPSKSAPAGTWKDSTSTLARKTPWSRSPFSGWRCGSARPSPSSAKAST